MSRFVRLKQHHSPGADLWMRASAIEAVYAVGSTSFVHVGGTGHSVAGSPDEILAAIREAEGNAKEWLPGDMPPKSHIKTSANILRDLADQKCEDDYGAIAYYATADWLERVAEGQR